MLMSIHWWCMAQARRYDAPGYPWRAAVFDIVGGWASKLYCRLRGD
jgi:hypothetical protein